MSETEAFVIEQIRLVTGRSGLAGVEHLRLESDLAMATPALGMGTLPGLLDSAVDRSLHHGIPMLQVLRSGAAVAAATAGDIARWASMLAPFVYPKTPVDPTTVNRELALLGAALIDMKHARDAGWQELTALFDQHRELSAVWIVDVDGVQNALAGPAFHDAFVQLVTTYAVATGATAADVLATPHVWKKLRELAQPAGELLIPPLPTGEVETWREMATATLEAFDFALPDEAAGWADENLPAAPAPGVDLLAAARARRDAILRDGRWFTGEELAVKARGAALESNTSQYASRLRREGRLFGVRVRGQYLHPAFQFQPSGEVHPAMARLIALLPTSDANWTAAFWLFQPTGALDGRRPVDVFPTDPQRVIDVAQKDLRGDRERW